MNTFRYQASENGGSPARGVIDAVDRKTALQLLGQRGLYPSKLELVSSIGSTPDAANSSNARKFQFGGGVKRKQITAFTREMSALLAAAIPIPQALDSLGEEEENPALRETVVQLADSLRKGTAFSAALAEQPKLFSNLYVSMIRVGEEAGELPKVMAELADLLEHEDEIRGEVTAAVAYPLFVLCFGIFTVTILLTVVLPRLFSSFATIPGATRTNTAVPARITRQVLTSGQKVTAARFSLEFEVTISAFAYGSLVMRTLP